MLAPKVNPSIFKINEVTVALFIKLAIYQSAYKYKYLGLAILI